MYISDDGLTKIYEKDITHVCVAPSLFPLLQYLLLVDEYTARNHTYYFFNEVIPFSIRKRVVCTYLPNQKDNSILIAIKKRIHKLLITFFKTIKYPFIRKAHIYAFDYTTLSLYIGNKNYDLLSDAPHCITYNMQEDSEEYIRQTARHKTIQWWIQKMVYGDIYVKYYGNNKWCDVIHLTEKNRSPILKEKKTSIRSLEDLWSAASKSKKEYILSLFDVSQRDIKKLNSKPIIFFTQPLMEDCHLSEEEYLNLLNRLFEHYNHQDILIKTHPRDTFDYSKYFSKMPVYSKSVNSQLLKLIGLTPKRVVTFFSSAVEIFPETIECDCYGTDIHPKVYTMYGSSYQLQRAVNKMTL